METNIRKVYQWANGIKQYSAALSPDGRGTKATVRAVWSIISSLGPDVDGQNPANILRTIFYAETVETIAAYVANANAVIAKSTQEDQLSKREAVRDKVLKSKANKALLSEHLRAQGIMIAVKERQAAIEQALIANIAKALKEAELNTESLWFDGETVRVSAQMSEEGRPTGPRNRPVYEYKNVHEGTRYPAEKAHTFTRKEIIDAVISIYAYRGESEWLARIEQVTKAKTYKHVAGGATPYAACKAAVRWLLVQRLGPEKGNDAQISYNWNKLLGIPVVGNEGQATEA